MEYKAYSFDLDDNLLVLPTKVILETRKGKKKEYNTRDFEKIRNSLEKLDLKVVSGSFRNFTDDEQFLEDIKNSKNAGSWPYLIECIVDHASIFAIITARGHSPEAIRKGLGERILKDLTEQQLAKFVQSFKKRFKENIKDKSSEEIFNIYLNHCRFYPATNPIINEKYGKEKTVSEIKAISFRDFRKYLEKYIQENFEEKVELKIGFSDDSTAHLSSIANSVLKDYGFFFFQTKEKGVSDFISSNFSK
ncbi:hypothetical protein H8D91_02390 [archaeon]|nr:hypothetical protein [archaeon]